MWCQCLTDPMTQLKVQDVTSLDVLPQSYPAFQDHGVVINPVKCELGVTQLQFLRCQIDSSSINPLEDKVQVVREFSQVATQCKLCKFLRFVNFYHHFLSHAAQILQPLYRLLAETKMALQNCAGLVKQLQPLSTSRRLSSMLHSFCIPNLQLMPKQRSCVMLQI